MANFNIEELVLNECKKKYRRKTDIIKSFVHKSTYKEAFMDGVNCVLDILHAGLEKAEIELYDLKLEHND